MFFSPSSVHFTLALRMASFVLANCSVSRLFLHVAYSFYSSMSFGLFRIIFIALSCKLVSKA